MMEIMGQLCRVVDVNFTIDTTKKSKTKNQGVSLKTIARVASKHIFKTPSELEFATVNSVAAFDSDVELENTNKLDESLNSNGVDSGILSRSNDLPQLNLLNPDNGNKCEND